jgi:hypothetical protein
MLSLHLKHVELETRLFIYSFYARKSSQIKVF